MSATHEVFLDAHVHLHACFHRPAFFDAALRNLRAAGATNAAPAGLMFTESHGVNAFGALRAAAESAPDPGRADGGAAGRAWSFAPTGEDNSLWARHGDAGDRLLIVAGRQVVTGDGLEVLALGCTEEIGDGGATGRTIAGVIERGFVPVLPWGFGKWWLRRGRLIADLLRGDFGGRWFIGDNGGRPRWSPRPRLFARAASRGVFVLPGSDPLPFPRQVDRPGSCGVKLAGRLDPTRPAASVLARLRDCDAQPATFATYENLASFARNQIAMQVAKRRPIPGTAASGASATDRRPS